MFRSLEKTYEEKAELNKIAQLPANRKLKYMALAFAVCGIALFIIMICGLDSFSLTAFLVLRGCAGLCGILFIIFVACYLYRVNYTYQKQKSIIKNHRNLRERNHNF